MEDQTVSLLTAGVLVALAVAVVLAGYWWEGRK